MTKNLVAIGFYKEINVEGLNIETRDIRYQRLLRQN